MHFGNYVRFEHTQRNISLPKQCVSLPKLKPEDPWTQNYEAKQWNLWIFSNNKKWNYASSDPVTCKQRNLDSDHCKQRNLDSDQLYSDLYNLLRAHAISAERARFSAEQAHVNCCWLARLRHITGFLIGCFLMRTMGRTIEPKFLDSFKNMKAASRQQSDVRWVGRQPTYRTYQPVSVGCRNFIWNTWLSFL